jgi:hypothetical protein
MRTRLVFLLPTLLLSLETAPLAQVSTSFALDESHFNAGGHPDGGATPFSTSYRITLDSIGDGVAAAGISSVSYRIDSGFVPSYPPPTEVLGVNLTNVQTLVWLPNATATGGYDVYRGLVSALSGLSYGSCVQQNLPVSTAIDTATAPAGDGYFFLVTAENTLNQNGTKGKDSFGTTRLGTLCP